MVKKGSDSLELREYNVEIFTNFLLSVYAGEIEGDLNDADYASLIVIISDLGVVSLEKPISQVLAKHEALLQKLVSDAFLENLSFASLLATYKVACKALPDDVLVRTAAGDHSKD